MVVNYIIRVHITFDVQVKQCLASANAYMHTRKSNKSICYHFFFSKFQLENFNSTFYLNLLLLLFEKCYM